MLSLALILTAIASFYCGTKYDWIRRSLTELGEQLKAKADAKKPDEKQSVFLDPLDIVTQARMEQEEIRRRLNQ
jgi:hypothetical protein